MQAQGNALTAWPTLEELEQVRQLVQKAHDELERLAWPLKPIYEEGREDIASFEQLGQLTSFVSIVAMTVDTMRELVEMLAQARDFQSPSFEL